MVDRRTETPANRLIEPLNPRSPKKCPSGIKKGSNAN
jgi:hypothetical protein